MKLIVNGQRYARAYVVTVDIGIIEVDLPVEDVDKVVAEFRTSRYSRFRLFSVKNGP